MQDWERFGEEIRRTVQDAVDSQDYRKLNQTITDTINRAVNGAVNGAEPVSYTHLWIGLKIFLDLRDLSVTLDKKRRVERCCKVIKTDNRAASFVI